MTKTKAKPTETTAASTVAAKLPPRVPTDFTNIDKIYVKVKRIGLALFIEEFRDKRRFCKKRGYSIDPNFSGNFDIYGKKITIQGNRHESEIQYNLKDFKSLSEFEAFHFALTGSTDGLITHLSCNVDIPFKLEDVRKAFTVPYKTAIKTFRSETTGFKGGYVREVELSGVYGSNRTMTFSIYDAQKKHKQLGYDKPTTRTEARFYKNSVSPIKRLKHLRNLNGKDVFSKIQLLKFDSGAHFDPNLKVWACLLYYVTEAEGLRNAISKLIELNPSHGHEVFNKIKEQMISLEIDLVAEFQIAFERFSSAHFLEADKEKINKLAEHIKNQSAIRVF